MPTPTVPKSPQTKAPGSHCFVLIHSTGQGAAGWDRLARVLAERGSTAHAVELPSDPDLPAAGYAELIRRQVGAVAAPIVLAHSPVQARCSPPPHVPSTHGARSGSRRGCRDRTRPSPRR
jgi:hypothetical protein